MNFALKKLICHSLAAALVIVPFQSVQAGMLGTDQVVSAAASQMDRSVVLGYLNRAQTVDELRAMGLNPQDAAQRVAAMTDAEVSTLAGQVNMLPAGADSGVLLLLAIGFGIWYFAFRR